MRAPRVAGRLRQGRSFVSFVSVVSFLSLIGIAPFERASAQNRPQPPEYPGLSTETPADFKPVTDDLEYVKRDLMIPMRDGVKLHTVIVLPKGASGAPILLTRTPYNA